MSLSRKIIFALRVGLALTVSRYAAAAADKFVGCCNVVFAGDSTLDRFTGDVTNVPLTVVCETNGAGTTVLNTRIEISPRQLTTHNSKRDANMYQMFRSDRFPQLCVVVTNAPLDAAQLATTGAHSKPGTLPVQVTICGITRECRAVTSDPKPNGDGWEFELETNLSLKAFQLEPPSLLLGAISVRDIVNVKAHVEVQKESPKP
jgi:hypothetical protein